MINHWQRVLNRVVHQLRQERNGRRRTGNRRSTPLKNAESLDARLLLTVTTTYAFDFVQNTDLTQGPSASQADATSLANGGIAVSGTHNAHTDVDIFNADLSDGGGRNVITGTNSAIDQLANGNLAVVTQDADSILYTILNGSGGVVVSTTDIGDVNSSQPDVAALTGGKFVIVNQDFVGGTDFDIDVRIRSSVGAVFFTFAIDSTSANDTNPAVTALDDGGFAVAWHRTIGGETEVWSAVYESNGIVRRAAAIADTAGSVNRNVDVSSKSGGFVVVYEDNGWGTGTNDITLAEFTSAGVFQGFSNISNPSFINDGSNDANPVVTRLFNNLLVVGFEDNSFGDTDNIVALFDAASNTRLTTRNIAGGESIVDDVGDLTIVGSALGRINVFQTNFTDGDIDGETLVGRRNSVSDAAGDLIIGDDFIDIMTGAGGNDTLSGLGGNDTLDGGSGNDILNGGLGNDTLKGGSEDDTYVFESASIGGEVDTLIELAGQGTDTLDFSSQATSVALNVGLTTLQAVHTNRSILLNLDNTFENANGGAADDVLHGNSVNNALTGNGGNDSLNGSDGSDALIGGLGDDTYAFGPAPAAEIDTLTETAGQGTDALNFTALTTSVTVNLGLTTSQVVHTNRSIVLNLDTTFENVSGGSADDVLRGNSVNNGLFGNGGNDSLNGSSGDDTLAGGPGDDTYALGPASAAEIDTLTEAAGQGTDTLNFTSLTTAVTVNIGLTTLQNVHTNRSIVLNSGTSFENIRGGLAGDALRGNSVNNSLFGNGGNDSLNGSGGDDTLVGGPGDDTYAFGPAAAVEVDTLTEAAGQGTDTLNFTALTTVVTLDLGVTASQVVHTNRSIVLNLNSTFENVRGGSADDVIRGNNTNNSLFGNGGNDTLVGLNGNDTLSGGLGNDFLIGGRGQDVLNGNGGEDLLISAYTFFAGVEDSAGFLQLVATEWSGPGTFEDRVDALTPVLVPGSTVINDGSVDTLTSNADLSLDWLFAALADGVVKDAGDLLTLL